MPSLCRLYIIAAFAALAIWLVPGAAHARTVDEPSFAEDQGICAASVPESLAIARIPAAALDWHCDGTTPPLGPGRIAVRIDAGDGQGGYFETRTGYLDALTMIAVRGDSAAAVERHEAQDIMASAAGVSFAVPVARSGPEIAAHIAVFEGAEFPTTITSARIVSQPRGKDPKAESERVTIAIFVGFLLLPTILNLGFYKALRAPFLLWHAGLALAMAVHLMTSGLIVLYWPMSINPMNHLAIGSFGLVMVCAVMFATRFVETERQSMKLRRALEIAAVCLMVITLARMARIDALEPYSAKFYYATFAPMLALMMWFVIDAARRGSRAVWFQLVAWVPFVILGILRIGTMLGTDGGYIDAQWLFRVGAVMEVVFTSLGIVDRIIKIRRERDAAVTEARMMEQLSERDPLTGLMNRRALEARFGELRRQGFDTFALIDLDRFKQINDRFGHQVGDRALIACAEAIRGGEDRDTIAVRLGGEEFVLLLRGKRAVERAESLRQSVPLRIASEVEGLDRPVTASMGVIELPRSSDTLMGFHDLYARADRLLYEAKATGRNRMYFERLKVFSERPQRRPADEAAA